MMFNAKRMRVISQKNTDTTVSGLIRMLNKTIKDYASRGYYVITYKASDKFSFLEMQFIGLHYNLKGFSFRWGYDNTITISWEDKNNNNLEVEQLE